jgi:hypothetical protein
VKGRNVMNQAKVLKGVVLRVGSWVDAHLGEGENTRCLPVGKSGLNLGRPHKIGLVRRSSTIRVRSRDVIVRASNLVLGAVAALGEVFVAANVSALARLTALARLGVAAARRTTTGTGHGCKRNGVLLVGARGLSSPARYKRAGSGSERS